MSSLDEQDIHFLYDEGIGLRHNEKAIIQKELKEGGFGDALALSAAYSLSRSPQQVEESIQDFIMANAVWFSSENGNGYAFITRGNQAPHPHDIEKYHGIGKWGVFRFEAKQVKAVVLQEEIRGYEPKAITAALYPKVILTIKTLSAGYQASGRKEQGDIYRWLSKTLPSPEDRCSSSSLKPQAPLRGQHSLKVRNEPKGCASRCKKFCLIS